MKKTRGKYTLQLGADNPILRSVAQEVPKITKDIKLLGLDLLELMREHEGVGIAAPQVGISLRVIATTQRKKKGKELDFLSEHVMINPMIVAKSKKMIVDKEACLSLPNITGSVARHEEIKVHYMDLEGKKQIKKLIGFDAVVVQHEVDHLDGILFIDKLLP